MLKLSKRQDDILNFIKQVDEAEYKKVLIIFYEQNSALYFKELFKEQFKLAVESYF